MVRGCSRADKNTESIQVGLFCCNRFHWRYSAMESSYSDVTVPLAGHADRLLTEPQMKPPEPVTHKGVDTGWSWAVLFASFGVFVCIGGTMLAVGIIHTTLLLRFNESVALTSWAGSLHSALVSIGGPLSSVLIDRFSCRMALIVSGFCYVIGYICTAFAPNIYVAIFTCGIIAGCGGAFGYTAALVVVGFNFDRRRNIAIGVAVSGVGLGLLSFAPLMEMARENYGTVGFFITLAAMTANIVTFGCMCFPSSLELKSQHDRKLQSREQLKDKTSSCLYSLLGNYTAVITNKAVICLCFSMFFYCFGTYLMFVHLQSYIIFKGFSAKHASYFMSLPGFMTVGGRIATGILANLRLVKDIIIYSGCMFVVFVIITSFPLYASFTAGQIVYGVTFGLMFGSCYVILPSVSIQYVGINYFSSSIGLMFFFAGVGSLVGPLFAGIIVDSGGSYDYAVITAGVTTLLGGLSGAATVFFPHTDSPATTLDAELDEKPLQEREINGYIPVE